MAQKARNLATLADAIAANARAIERIESQLTLMKVPQVVSVPSFGSSPSSSTIGDSANLLDVNGGTMKGPIGFGDRQLIIDINNQIDISQLSVNSVDGESDYTSTGLFNLISSASTQLDTIVGAANSVQFLLLRGPGTSQIITQNISLNIDNIVGDGVTQIITVTVADGSALATNNNVNIVGTTSGAFDATDVTITKTGTNTFTYDLGSVGSATASSAGQVARGNIQTQDGKDIIVTGANTFQSWLLYFDPILSNTGGEGLWRVVAGTNSVVADASNATLRLTANQGSTGVVLWNSNTITGSGITDEGSGIFKLTGDIFDLSTHIRTTSSGATGTLDIQWQTATDVAFTTPVNVGIKGVVLPPSQTSNLSSLPYCSARVDASSSIVFVRLFSSNPTAFTNILSASSVGLISSGIVGGGGGGGNGGISFPINFPEDNLGTLGTETLNFTWLSANRHSQIITLDGDLTISIGTDLPLGTTGFTIFALTQDVTGGRTVTFTGLANASPAIDQTAGNTTYIGVQRINAISEAFTVGDKIFVGSTADQWSQFPATQAVNMAGNQLFNYLGYTASSGAVNLVNDSGITNFVPTGDFHKWMVNNIAKFTIDESQLNAHLSPLVNVSAISLVDTGDNTRGSITADPGAQAVRLATAVGEKFIISDVITNIAEFDNATGLKMIGSHDINLNKRKMNTIGSLLFDETTTFTPSATDVVIGADGLNSDLIRNVPTGWIHAWKVNNVQVMFANANSLNFVDNYQVKCNPGASVAGINVGIVTADPTILANSDMWYNSTSNQLKARINGASVALGPSNTITQGNSNATITDVGSGVFIVNIDGVTNAKFSVQANRVDIEELPLFGLTALNFNKTGPVLLGTVLTQNTTDFTMNFPTNTDVYNINFNAAVGLSVDKFKTRLYSNTPNTSGASLSLFRDDPSPLAFDEVGKINFDGNNSAAGLTTYGSISTTIVDPLSTNETARMLFNLFDKNLSSNILTLTQGRMTLNKFSTEATDATEFRIQKEDASPGNGDNIGILKYGVDDSGTFTTYAALEGINTNTLDAGELKIQVLADGNLLDAIRITGETTFSGAQLRLPAQLHSDIKFSSGFTVDFNAGQSNVGAAGFANILPNRPVTYLIIKQGGTEFLVPAYNKP